MKPLQDYIIAGVIKTMGIEFGLDIHWTQSSSFNDAFAAIKDNSRQKGEFAFLRINSITLNNATDSNTVSGAIRPHALTYKGLRGAVTKVKTADPSILRQAIREKADSVRSSPRGVLLSDLLAPEKDTTPGKIESAILNLKLTPINIDCTLIYSTEDTSQLLQLFARWSFAQANSRISFNLNYLGITLPIAVTLGSDLSIPDREEIATARNSIWYEGSAVIGGFMSNDDKRDVASIPLIHYTELDTDSI